MIFLLMLLLKVNVEHLLADGAFLDIPPAVTEMSSHLRLGKILETVIAPLVSFLLHILEIIFKN
jgi:hypothetical protein